MAQLPYQTALAYQAYGNIPWQQRLAKAYQQATGRNDYSGSAAQNAAAQSFMMRSPQVAQPVASTPTPQSPAAALVEKMGKFLNVQKSPDQILSPDSFKDPLRKTFESTVIPGMQASYNLYEKNPYLQQTGDQMASSSMNMDGKFNPLFTTQMGQMNNNFEDKLDVARKSYENTIDDMYQKKLKTISESPTQGV